MAPANAKAKDYSKRKILVLHGDRQTGDLLVGRMSSLKRKLLKPRNYKNGPLADEIDPSIQKIISDNAEILGKDPNNCKIEFVAPDGPYVWKADPSVHRNVPQSEEAQRENDLMRTWWERNGNDYGGLEESLDMILATWNSASATSSVGDVDGDGDDDESCEFEGILGFSRGARLTHLIATLHEASGGLLFHGLKYVIMASGYGGVPFPSNFPPRGKVWESARSENVRVLSDSDVKISIPSMHIMGNKDRLIPVESSRLLLSSYENPRVHEHDGGHHVPMRAADCRAILSFIDSVPLVPIVQTKMKQEKEADVEAITSKAATPPSEEPQEPDEEHAQAQVEECESLTMIFPDEFKLLSGTNGTVVDEYDEEHLKYTHPISYLIQLKPPADQLEDDEEMKQLWPIRDIALKVEYTINYPDVMPKFSLHHDMNVLEFTSSQSDACLEAVREVASAEEGMPCVMSCIYRAREFFEDGGLVASLNYNGGVGTGVGTGVGKDANTEDASTGESSDVGEEDPSSYSSLLKPSSKERIKQCIEDGLQIGYSILDRKAKAASSNNQHETKVDSSNGKEEAPSVLSNGKGGSWKYTIGLVGKPSAGKSTFFNAATAFARQRGGDEVNEDGVAIGGASMAPHPFTTIDPNIGCCLIPAPDGSCPEDDLRRSDSDSGSGSWKDAFGSIATTHGRDSYGRRLIPVMLKDVAGLVPGAYQGRGRGNKFLDDLTDADVLIHVLDSSGTADSEGNKVVVDVVGDDGEDAVGSHPIDDLGWIFNELIQWVYFNLKTKWDTVARKGRAKLAGMLSGYKQSMSFVWDVLVEFEKDMYQKQGRDNALDHLETWDEGDLYMLVSAFLSARFPVGLALNKYDIPSAKKFCEEIIQALPIHGAHSGTTMSAHEEMKYVRQNIYSVLGGDLGKAKVDIKSVSPPHGVWNCLQSAIKLREPILVFPVVDMDTFEPLPGLNDLAINNFSLPNAGMISCLEAAGGAAPTLWNRERVAYSHANTSNDKQLRDVLILKQGSTVEDVFSSLKGMGALSGEFVRAEAAGKIGEKPNLVKKDEKLGRHNRIIKIMTTKRREWQKKL